MSLPPGTHGRACSWGFGGGFGQRKFLGSRRFGGRQRVSAGAHDFGAGGSFEVVHRRAMGGRGGGDGGGGSLIPAQTVLSVQFSPHAVDPAGPLRGFVASCDQKSRVSFGDLVSAEAGNASHEDTNTRRRQARGCSRRRSSDPLRRRVGTQPAATRPLVDREPTTSLRADLGGSG